MTTITLSQLVTALAKRLLDPDGTPQRKAWLGSLSIENGGFHLGACLLIDLLVAEKSRDRAVAEPANFAHCSTCLAMLIGEVLDHISDDDEGGPVLRFARALEECESADRQRWWGSRLVSSEHLQERLVYVRVLELGQFIKHYLRSRAFTLADDDVRTVRQLYLADSSGTSLRGMTEWWSGGRGRVWVLPLEDYEGIVNNQEGIPPATALIDALGLPCTFGLSPDGFPEMIVVEYPSCTDGIRITRPTSLDANWKTEPFVFLAGGPDETWGKTCSRSGRQWSCRERVHDEFRMKMDDFKVKPVGVASLTPQNSEHVLSQAVSRITECLGELRS
jgi:hypothetical protein